MESCTIVPVIAITGPSCSARKPVAYRYRHRRALFYEYGYACITFIADEQSILEILK
jgi:hypothetical protein